MKTFAAFVALVMCLGSPLVAAADSFDDTYADAILVDSSPPLEVARNVPDMAGSAFVAAPATDCAPGNSQVLEVGDIVLHEAIDSAIALYATVDEAIATAPVQPEATAPEATPTLTLPRPNAGGVPAANQTIAARPRTILLC